MSAPFRSTAPFALKFIAQSNCTIRLQPTSNQGIPFLGSRTLRLRNPGRHRCQHHTRRTSPFGLEVHCAIEPGLLSSGHLQLWQSLPGFSNSPPSQSKTLPMSAPTRRTAPFALKPLRNRIAPFVFRPSPTRASLSWILKLSTTALQERCRCQRHTGDTSPFALKPLRKMTAPFVLRISPTRASPSGFSNSPPSQFRSPPMSAPYRCTALIALEAI
jgi:hypothetical protein